MLMRAFDYHGKPIHIGMDEDRAVWFAVKDVANACGLGSSHTLTDRVPIGEKAIGTVNTRRGRRKMLAVSTIGFAQILAAGKKSKKASAFCDWVVVELLPILRALTPP